MSKKMPVLSSGHIPGRRLLLIVCSILVVLSFVGFKGWQGADLGSTCQWRLCEHLQQATRIVHMNSPEPTLGPLPQHAVVHPAAIMIAPGKIGGEPKVDEVGAQYSLEEVLRSEEDGRQRPAQIEKEEKDEAWTNQEGSLAGTGAGSAADQGLAAGVKPAKKRRKRKEDTAGSLSSGPEFIHCNRSSPLTDICTLRGDIRVDLASGQIVLYARKPETPRGTERLRPMPRKWDTKVMQDLVTQLSILLVSADDPAAPAMKCTRHSSTPGVMFSAGGFCGKPFHDFNEVYLPLFETTQAYRRNVTLLVSDLKGEWWWEEDPTRTFVGAMTENAIRLVGQEIDSHGDPQGVECFSQLTVGLYQHLCLYDEYGGMEERNLGKTEMADFAPFIRAGLKIADPVESRVFVPPGTTPVVGIVQRSDERRLTNFEELLRVAERDGFTAIPLLVEELRQEEVAEAMAALDVLVGVHGDGLTSIALMRPGGVVLQVLPFAEGGPRNHVGREFKLLALEMDLDYHEWRVPLHESSLRDRFNCTDDVLASPIKIWTQLEYEDALTIYHAQDVAMPAEMFAAYLGQFKRTLYRKASLAKESS